MARFVLDNEFPHGTGVELQRLGHDVASARSTNREHHHDEDQLLFAATEKRILVTHNRRDFVLLHDAWQRWSQAWGVTAQHDGILVFRQGQTYRHYAAQIAHYIGQADEIPNTLHLHEIGRQWATFRGPS